VKQTHSDFILNDEQWKLLRLENWLQLLKKSFYGAMIPLKIESSPIKNEGEKAFSSSKDYRDIAQGSAWGKGWDYAWFRLQGTIPEHWQGKAVDIVLDLEGELSLFDAKGHIYRRLTWGSAFGVPCQVDDIHLHDACKGGEVHTIFAQAWASSIVGVDRPQDPTLEDPQLNGQHQAQVKMAHLAILRPEVKKLYWDVEVLLGLAKELPELSSHRAKIVKALMAACVAWQDQPERSGLCREILKPELARPSASSSLTAVAIGHAHIDTAWLWRVGDSIGKCARTFASQAELLDKYPEYRFGASSAQHYQFIKEQHPDLHQRIQALVKEGRWELLGGMWVEPDTNLPSGESLIRQILYAQKFFREEFSAECEVAWLPDVFGLSAALPQILLKSGIKYLVTKKPHWGRGNRYPNTTLRWSGNDGSEILVHVLPQARDYNGLMRPLDLAAAEKGFTENADFDQFVYSMGVGDGGGGPSENIIERALRMKSLEGLPQVEFSSVTKVLEGFDEQRQLLKKQQGEMYVEGHRGTYTTQAQLKGFNRKLENLLVQWEYLFCYLPEKAYPYQDFEKMWQSLLLHQFHDILPGSCIREVVEDTLGAYRQIEANLEHLRQTFGTHLTRRKAVTSLFNGLNHMWCGTLLLDMALKPRDQFSKCLSQREPDGRVANVVEISKGGFSEFEQSSEVQGIEHLETPVLENEHLRCEFNPDATIKSLYDKKQKKQILREGQSGNCLSLYVDRPIDWDAWDIDAMYKNEKIEQAQPVAEWTGWKGSARSVLVFRLRIGSSSIEQKCSLTTHALQIDFETTVVWRERHRMLRVGFEADVRQAVARCEIQHGYMERPTHKNTSFEEARFEVPCHRYACLLDAKGGIAVLNDSKYGVSIEESSLELALLRSTTFPDHSADIGTHHFTYALRPLESKEAFNSLPQEAANLNIQPLLFSDLSAEKYARPFVITGADVSVEALKRREDGNGLVLRLAELGGEYASIMVKDSRPWYKADLMERQIEVESVTQKHISLKPFEIVTFVTQT
jgi:alpha-mannosidase